MYFCQSLSLLFKYGHYGRTEVIFMRDLLHPFDFGIYSEMVNAGDDQKPMWLWACKACHEVLEESRYSIYPANEELKHLKECKA